MMIYNDTITLKNGAPCTIRTADIADAQAVLAVFNLTHAQTDFLLTYPEEKKMALDEEQEFLAKQAASPNAVELCAMADGKIVGTAGFEVVGTKEKLRHRAEFGIAIEQAYWGLGIGEALTSACIHCAEQAGYRQLELDVVAENTAAIALYKKLGFVEFGRNPRGFSSRTAGWQALVLMRLELPCPTDGALTQR